MSALKATYTTKSNCQVIEVPFDSTKPLTDSIINLQEKVNTLLTNVLEEEKQAKKVAEVVKTVQQDEAEDELKEMAEAEAEAEADTDSPMSVDRPEIEDKQSTKKQKTDL
jgi:hypothetical protein